MYLQDIRKVAVLKRSAKGAMSCSCRRARFTYPCISKNSAETQCLIKVFQVLAKSLRKTFLAASRGSTTGAMSSSFRRAPCT